MSMENDETLQIYIEESLEHLADIENDFLAIEAAGADIDEDLVNKVYRAAHSIKGGAGFMGLTNIKDLTHEMENILGKIRSREMIPNPEMINILLSASDLLGQMINDVENSNEVDISEHLAALKAVGEGGQPLQEEPADPKEEEREEEASSVSVEPQESPAPVEEPSHEAVVLSLPDDEFFISVDKEPLLAAMTEGKHVYLVAIDLIRDIHMRDKTPQDLIQEMEQAGSVLSGKVDIDAAGTLEQGAPLRLPYVVVFATILKPNDIDALFEIEKENIFQVTEDFTLKEIVEKEKEVDEPSATSIPAEPQPVPQKEEAVAESGWQDEELVQEPIPSQQELGEKVDNAVSEETVKETRNSPSAKPQGPQDTSLRVHVSLLDSLMNLAGELVLSRNQLLQSMSIGDQRASEIAGQRIDLITSELQEAIMLTRMQPIGSVFNKFPRVVRDLARNLGKEVDLTLEGKEVELDKTIIESISDPLTHLVRNAVDHGIELPEERTRAGKKAMGRVLLRAFHEAGQVNIEIRDDGKGLDGDKLAATAVAKGIATEEQIKMMSDKEKVNLIFLPGFSTAEKVTDVSGRGVGMDVVKTNLDKLGGVVDIDTRPGEGTVIGIKLPLTLAIIPSQIIVTGGERYAIPQVNMEELLRIPADKVKDRIEKVGDADVVRLRGNLLPLIRLADVIGAEGTYFDAGEGREKRDRRKNIADRRSKKTLVKYEDGDVEEQGEGNPEMPSFRKERDPNDRRFHADSAVNIVVVSAGALKYGLVVDELHDSEEIVVKPLGRHLKHTKGYAGATIMGDGRVALILDVAGLSRMAELTSIEAADGSAGEVRDSGQSKEDIQSLLLFRNAEEEQFAVPLGLVSRIEKAKRTMLEEVGGKRVMQYRGKSLPLIAIEDVAKVTPMGDKEDLIVIVFLIAGKEVGLLGTAPVDATEISVEFDEITLKQTGVMGSAIINDYTTMMVDIYDMVEKINPDWFSGREEITMEDGEALTLLYAEDSNFFRSQVKGFLEEDGYKVIEAEDGMVAWDLIQKHAGEISMVVTDIEMPNLDGYGLAKKIKEDPRFSNLPIVGLTTLASDEDIAKGKEAGIDDYQIKLDKEKLLGSIHDFLAKIY